MDDEQVSGALSFLQAAGKLKDVLRSAYTSEGKRESTAEHTWRLCLMAIVFETSLPDIDFLKLLKICVLHDLGEAISGDIPAIDQRPDSNKSARERQDLLTLLSPLPSEVGSHFTALWDEYEAAASPEARLAKGFDKLETILQHNQGKNPEGFDYGFNLSYGQKHTKAHPLLDQIRRLLDQETSARISSSGSGEHL
jgi:putative hydrolases of HD superfamily